MIRMYLQEAAYRLDAVAFESAKLAQIAIAKVKQGMIIKAWIALKAGSAKHKFR